MPNARVAIDLSRIYEKFSQENIERGRYAMANQMLADMEQFVPYDEGTLTGSGMVGSNGATLSWDTPYARRWFYNSANFQKTVHPLATNRWDEAAKGLYMPDWEAAFVKGAGL